MTLSSAEAEYYALTGAASEALGLQEATRFLTGDLVELKAFTDSSSARAIAARQGVGKIKHLATRMLWLQQAQKEGRLSVPLSARIKKPSGHCNEAFSIEKNLTVDVLPSILQQWKENWRRTTSRSKIKRTCEKSLKGNHKEQQHDADVSCYPCQCIAASV